jgi:hypothetical protein
MPVERRGRVIAIERVNPQRDEPASVLTLTFGSWF